MSAIACRIVKEDGFDCLYIVALATLVSYRSVGLASSLLKWAEKQAIDKKCQMISLHCQLCNESLIEFYLKRGFKIAERIPDYYPTLSSHEAVRLVKDL